jgi:xylulokinase
MSLVGLDVGTTGCKAIVFDEEGSILGQASREYAILTPRPNWVEQDADHVWGLAWDALSEAVAQARDDPPVALALSVQGEAIAPVDGGGTPMRPMILGMDTRTEAENAWLADRFGAETLFDRTGMPMHTVNTLPKMVWLKANEPEIWRTADQFLLYEDLFLRRLGGEPRISHCLASRTQMYDLDTGDWAEDILSECGIESWRLARLAPADGGVVGTLRPELASELGIGNEVLLVSGGHDQACASVGAGVVEAGRAMVSTGTAEVVEVAMAAPTLDDTLRDGGISVYRHVVPGLYLAMTLNHSGGLLLRWFRDTLCRWERERARETGEDAYDLILADVPEGPTRLMVLPHFAGAGTPVLDTRSKGAILGMTFATTRATIAKAILEGLVFELRMNTDLLQAAGIPIEALHAVGGGARSSLWLQLKADICHIPLRVPTVTEAACRGAALLAGVGVGVYPDLKTAVEQVVRFERRVEPREEVARAYDERYGLYRQVYPTLIDLQRHIW